MASLSLCPQFETNLMSNKQLITKFCIKILSYSQLKNFLSGQLLYGTMALTRASQKAFGIEVCGVK